MLTEQCICTVTSMKSKKQQGVVPSQLKVSPAIVSLCLQGLCAGLCSGGIIIVVVEGWLAGLEAVSDTEHSGGEKGYPLPCQTIIYRDEAKLQYLPFLYTVEPLIINHPNNENLPIMSFFLRSYPCILFKF